MSTIEIMFLMRILTVYTCRLGAIGSAVCAVNTYAAHPVASFSLILISPVFWMLGDLYQKEQSKC